jgi:hypothetical protein
MGRATEGTLAAASFESRSFVLARRGIIGITVGLAVACLASPARAVSYTQQWIANNSGVQATDLELMFSAAVQNMKLSGNPGLSGANVMVGTPSSNWSATGLRVNDGTEVNIRWASNNVPPPTITGGNWTQNGNPVKAISPANNNIMGRPAQITYNQFTAQATFTNDQPFAESYTNVAAYVDNNPANYNIDAFDTPSGTQVGSTTSFTLAPSGSPGDTMTFNLGTVNPNDYELVLATVAASSTPTITFDNAASAMVPEPASGLFALCGVPMLLRRRRRI